MHTIEVCEYNAFCLFMILGFFSFFSYLIFNATMNILCICVLMFMCENFSQVYIQMYMLDVSIIGPYSV